MTLPIVKHMLQVTERELDAIDPRWRDTAMNPKFREWIAPQIPFNVANPSAEWWAERMLAFKHEVVNGLWGVHPKLQTITAGPRTVVSLTAPAAARFTRAEEMQVEKALADMREWERQVNRGWLENYYLAGAAQQDFQIQQMRELMEQTCSTPTRTVLDPEKLQTKHPEAWAAAAKDLLTKGCGVVRLDLDGAAEAVDIWAPAQAQYSFGNKHYVGQSEGTSVKWHNEPRCVGENEPHLYGAPQDNVFTLRHNEWRCLPRQAVLRFEGRLPAVGRGVVVISACTVHHGNDGPALLLDDRTGQIDLVVIEDTLRVVNLAGRETEIGAGHYKPSDLNARVEKAARRSVREWTL